MIVDNPTQIRSEPNPLYSDEPLKGPADSRLEGAKKGKGNAEGALGVFAKLLAGLVRKNNQTISGVQTGMDRTGEDSKTGQISEETRKSGQKGKDIKSLWADSRKKPGDSKKISPENRNMALTRQHRAEKAPAEKAPRENPEAGALLAAGEVLTLDKRRPDEVVVPVEGADAGEGADVLKLPRNRELDAAGMGEKLFPGNFPGKGKPEQAGAPAREQIRDDKAGEKTSEAKPRDKRRDKLVVEDYRSSVDGRGLVEGQGLKAAEAAKNPAEREILVNLKLHGDQPGTSENRTVPDFQNNGPGFETLLARELRGELSTDIVRQAAIVLRDGGGTIKLSLRPEALGKVKIHLDMAENKISGHILLETEEALRAFEREIHTLEQAFRDSGFEASLDMALDSRAGGQQWKGEEASPFFSQRLAASSYDAESLGPEASGGYASLGELTAVNMLV